MSQHVGAGLSESVQPYHVILGRAVLCRSHAVSPVLDDGHTVCTHGLFESVLRPGLAQRHGDLEAPRQRSSYFDRIEMNEQGRVQ